jgi:predicted CopG family antitoxin
MKNIKVDEEVHKKLNIIKAEKGFKSINELLKDMLEL